MKYYFIGFILLIFLNQNVFCNKLFTEIIYQNKFISWANENNKFYETLDFKKRYEIFKYNMDFIYSWNKGNSQTILGLNKYADLSNEEYKSLFLGSNIKTQNYIRINSSRYDIPTTFDWRLKGAVTPVKNQGFCNSGYAFSAIGSLESSNKIENGQLIRLSEQNLIDCSGSEGNRGCDGGTVVNSFNYLFKHQNGKIPKESSYPYEAQKSKCRFKDQFIGATLNNFANLISDESTIQNAVATKGPVSVAIDASSIFFQLYFGGVYDDLFCSNIYTNHFVLIVGYTENYWIVKNSYGEDYGIDGYIYMKKGKNLCGIANNPTIPIII
ncbi:hypothetical protein DICPUDRAFT_77394 [Dictyostelium purpureum]|uniref:Peptidase C1A papain C-terminal domain-containing protein n=1 Tax=Dictyostelium purpureum TaxID=5786 RepID=F0ZGH2_DICPU|nr:uncharacterized protein DICPUDRAFT_77394 [Dictyostelium purpureum]EGC36943.1 hypothetical protein DICPUDRAFT_77394 [Dictyostelium purpureum]|eukprot:XP_003286511.1 hypothetical protein DICPUDRAFT_77394 [Dictyostelium purpureum]